MYFILYHVVNLYNAKRTINVYKECRHIVNANMFGALILILILFILKLINYSRLVLLLFIFYNITLTSLIRIIKRFLLRKYRSKGFNQKHCVIIGTTSMANELTDKINKNKQWGYNIVGYLSEEKEAENIVEKNDILGNLDNLEYILKNTYLDMVFITLAPKDFIRLEYIIKQCEKAGVKTNMVPYYYNYIPSKPYIDDLDGIPIIDTRHVPLDNYFNSACKRLFDIFFSVFAILLTSPIMLVTIILIKLTSPGPIIYKQTRVGLNRKNFDMYKFRSMRVQEEKVEKTQWTTKNDPRKTKWGSIIRKTSIDELPQFFNVLKGDMSIVGPRPERPFFVEKFKDEIPRYMIKHQVRPGITGWAQVNGYRGDTSIEKRIEHDLYYIENWTFLFDIKIIFLTIFKGIVNQNAY
ncbi:undecaprenyl-phosphate glucose phosphotransferase [Clostridioides difficile]|nr:undecaprenyl-phosphate glucose phosphotransferase [Clostridioides difficile]